MRRSGTFMSKLKPIERRMMSYHERRNGHFIADIWYYTENLRLCPTLSRLSFDMDEQY